LRRMDFVHRMFKTIFDRFIGFYTNRALSGIVRWDGICCVVELMFTRCAVRRVFSGVRSLGARWIPFEGTLRSTFGSPVMGAKFCWKHFCLMVKKLSPHFIKIKCYKVSIG